MVFLHPTILRDVETADYYSRSKYDDLRSEQLGLFESDELIGKQAPKLPDLHLFFQGQRVDNVKDTIGTIVPTSSINNNEPKLETDFPQIDRLERQAGAKAAIGPFDTTN